jgi:hypothetical protein
MTVWKKLQREWTAITTGTTWLFAAVIAGFRAPPVSDGQFGGGGSIPKFLAIVLPVLGLLITYIIAGKGRKASSWWIAGTVSLVLSIAAFVGYNWLGTSWTTLYDGQSIVIGSDFTLHGKAWVEKHPEWVSVAEWVKAHAGRVDEIWTKASINYRCLVISMMYVLSLPCAALAIVCSAQALIVQRNETAA